MVLKIIRINYLDIFVKVLKISYFWISQKFIFMKAILIFILSMPLLVYSQKVFKVDHAYQADIKVFSVQHAYQADLKVYTVNHAYQAREDGLWFFTNHAYQADKKIFFTNHNYQADLLIYFVDHSYQAGWNNRSKMHLLK